MLSVCSTVWEAQRPRLWQRFEQRQNCGVVAKRLADVREPIHISRSEHKASAQLKRILPQFMLMVAASAGAPSRRGVFASQEMQRVRGLQFRHSISLACFVD
jgi:hypothetical protein